jgi:hypothetical protein
MVSEYGSNGRISRIELFTTNNERGIFLYPLGGSKKQTPGSFSQTYFLVKKENAESMVNTFGELIRRCQS